MKFALILSTVAIASLTACSSAPRVPDYECPLNDTAGAKCASVEQAYDASTRMKKDGDLSRVQSVFDRRVQQREEQKPFFQGQVSDYPEPGATGKPVYQQPRVLRPWIAPYVDADGNLRSGEYTYFATPGRWNYGELRKPGAASGIFAPARPDSLGFNPVAPASTSKAPPRPAEPSRPAAAGQPASAGATPAPAAARPATDSTGITQPYQRLPN